MSFIKKWASCIVSFVAGVLGLALSALTGMSVSTKIDASALGTMGASITQSSTENIKAYEIVTKAERAEQSELYDIEGKFNVLKAFAIILVVVSILLIVYSLVMLLKNINVIKCNHKAFNIVGLVLITLLLASTIAVLASTSAYASALEVAAKDFAFGKYSAALGATTAGLITINIVASIGIYQWLMLAISIVAFISSVVITYLNKKKA